MSRKNKDALSDDEAAALSSSTIPEEIRDFVSRKKGGLDVRTSALRKVAAAAKAEREALTEVILLEAVKGKTSELTDARRKATEMERQKVELEARNRELEAEVMRAKAIPAMVVHGD